MKIIDLLIRIARDLTVPKQIRALGQIWTYEEGFGQYKNENFQELIKYLHGDYDSNCGLSYKAIYNYTVECLEESE